MARERPTEGRAAKRGREREEGEKGRTGNGGGESGLEEGKKDLMS